MKQLVGAVLILIGFQVNAAQIRFGEELVPLKLNNTQVEQSLFSKVTELEAAVGLHRVQLKYSDLYEVDYDDHEVIESKPFWIQVEIKNERDDVFISIERPESVEEAKLFAKKPVAVIQNAQDKHVAKVVPEPMPALAPVTVNQPVKPLKQAAVDAPVSQRPDPLFMLEYWWQRASDEQKAAFLSSKNKAQ